VKAEAGADEIASIAAPARAAANPPTNTRLFIRPSYSEFPCQRAEITGRGLNSP
jgi:hypothetical protein